MVIFNIYKSRDQKLRISESMKYRCQDQNPESMKYRCQDQNPELSKKGLVWWNFCSISSKFNTKIDPSLERPWSGLFKIINGHGLKKHPKGAPGVL
jgi:hypothetical protein